MTEQTPQQPIQYAQPGELPPQTFTQPHGLVTNQKKNGLVTVIAWVLAVLTLTYMLPWAVAATRGKSNQGAIAVLNLLLGWTLIGWIVALVMACGSHQVAYAGGR